MSKQNCQFLYLSAQDIAAHREPFEAFIMAAMMKSTGEQLQPLLDAYPDIWTDLQNAHDDRLTEIQGPR